MAFPKVAKVLGFWFQIFYNKINWHHVALPKVAKVLGFLMATSLE